MLRMVRKGGRSDLPCTSDFGPLLREFRTKRNLTQRQLRDRVGKDHTYVAHLEQGRRCPSPAVTDSLARALDLNNIERAAFFWEAGVPQASPFTKLGLEPEMRELVEVMASEELPFLHKQSLLKTLGALRDATHAAFPGLRNSNGDVYSPLPFPRKD